MEKTTDKETAIQVVMALTYLYKIRPETLVSDPFFDVPPAQPDSTEDQTSFILKALLDIASLKIEANGDTVTKVATTTVLAPELVKSSLF